MWRENWRTDSDDFGLGFALGLGRSKADVHDDNNDEPNNPVISNKREEQKSMLVQGFCCGVSLFIISQFPTIRSHHDQTRIDRLQRIKNISLKFWSYGVRFVYIVGCLNAFLFTQSAQRSHIEMSPSMPYQVSEVAVTGTFY